MAVRTRRVYGPRPIAVASTVIYTVPADRTLIIKEFRCRNSAAGQLVAPLVISNGAEGLSGELLRFVVPANSQVLEIAETVLNPGDVLSVSATGVGLHLYIAGSLLAGAPS